MHHLSWVVVFGVFMASLNPGFKETKAKKPLAGIALKAEIPIRFRDTVNDLGKKVFYSTCYSCHKDSITTLAPGQSLLASMPPKSILAALENGKMKVQGSTLTENERKAVSQWLTQMKLVSNELPKEAYTKFSLPAASNKFDHSGWGGNLASTGFRSAIQAGINKENVSSLSLKWIFPFQGGNVTRSKPAIVGNWLIAGGQYGDVYAIDRQTGKVGWHFEAKAAIRGAIVTTRSGDAITAYFADFGTNVYAIDVRNGKLIWTNKAALDQLSTTTGSVAVYNNKVYIPISSLEVAIAANGKYDCCASAGGVVAMDAHNGNIIWRYRTVPGKAVQQGLKKNGKPYFGPSGAPVWCSPTIDAKRGLLYIGTGENYSRPVTNTSDAVQALDLNTGKLVWNFQGTTDDAFNVACPILVNCPEKSGPDLDFGMAPILVKGKDGKDMLLAGQKSGVVYALTPSGKLIWKTRVGKGGSLGGIHWGMATDGKYLYAANSDQIYGLDKRDSTIKASPGMYALEVATGKVIWKTASPECSGKGCLASNSAAPIVVPGLVFAGGLDGHIRAYSTSDGMILWDFDTAKDFGIVNGYKAQGGAIDGPSPVVADGMLYISSGYAQFGQMPGNVILAFSVKK